MLFVFVQRSYRNEDCTQTTQRVLRSIQQASSGRGNNFTLLHFIDVFKGALTLLSLYARGARDIAMIS